MRPWQRAARVAGHQTLLHRENEVVSRAQRRGSRDRLSPAQPLLKAVNGLAEAFGQQSLLGQAQFLDVIQQLVGLGEEPAPMLLGAVQPVEDDGSHGAGR
jgi:hypothetical protein